MNFKTTSILLEELKPYLENCVIDISSDEENITDLVTIDDKNRVAFEVFENEIIVFFFTDHRHFEYPHGNSTHSVGHFDPACTVLHQSSYYGQVYAGGQC